MKQILERIKNDEVLVADGAMGTMLIEKGLEPGACPEYLNISHPQTVEEITQLYLDAGAEIIQSNTFGASPLKLSRYSLQDRTEEINKNAIKCVRNVVGESAYISAPCGPTGLILKPYGDTEPQVIYDSYRRQMKAQIEAGADIICIETMIDLNEARLAIKAAKSISPEKPVIATMTFEDTPRGFYTIMGTKIEDAALALELEGADIIGSNCGNGIQTMVEIAREFKRHSKLPLIIQSNSGILSIQGNRVFYSDTPEFMAEKARELIAIGVSIIGGCCGTTPEHIRAIRKVVNSLKAC